MIVSAILTCATFINDFQVVKGFNLEFDTLFQATALMDRVLSSIKIPRTLFQKLGLACVFVASKVNECCPIGMVRMLDL